jgi:hypothetical protein
MYLVVESLIDHVFVDLTSSVSFPEPETLEVFGQSLVDHDLQRLVVLTGRTRRGIVSRENSRN